MVDEGKVPARRVYVKIMRVQVFTAVVLLALGGPLRAEERCPGSGEGFSLAAVNVVACSTTVPSAVYKSPDGRKSILVSLTAEGDPRIDVVADRLRTRVPTAQWPSPSALWSPASSALFVNYSTGGSVGNFEVRVAYWEQRAATVIDPARAVIRDFLAHYPKCFVAETPNVAGVAWLGERRLLIAAEVLPHSNCDSMGTFATYEVALPSGTILQKHGQIESKKRFGHLLGPRLLDAEDRCIIDPKSCWVPMLHRK